MGLPAFPCAQILIFWGGVQQGFNGFNHNPADYAQNVRCPVLLLHGDRDPRVTGAQIEAVHQGLKGEKHLEIFKGVEHESYAAARPEQWKQAVARFLARK